MKHQDLLKLYELRGTISGLIDVGEAELPTLKKLCDQAETTYLRGYVVGRRSVIIDTLHDLRSLRSGISRIIKEEEDVTDQTDETEPRCVHFRRPRN